MNHSKSLASHIIESVVRSQTEINFGCKPQNEFLKYSTTNNQFHYHFNLRNCKYRTILFKIRKTKIQCYGLRQSAPAISQTRVRPRYDAIIVFHFCSLSPQDLFLCDEIYVCRACAARKTRFDKKQNLCRLTYI